MARTARKPLVDGASPAAASSGPRMLIIHGTDRFLQDEALADLRRTLADSHASTDIDTVRFDGAQGARILPDILDECRSLGLMQQFKIVLVENAELLVKAGDDDAPVAGAGHPLPAAGGGKGTRARRRHAPLTPREVLEAYAQSPSETAVLVLRAGAWRPGNLDKAVARVGAVFKCEPPSFPVAVRKTQELAKARHQTSIDPKAAQALVNAAGTDLGRIDSELEKLALAAGGAGQPITLALVEAMTGTTREEEFWAIQSALLTGDAPGALAQLRNLVEVSRHDPVPITFACVEMARKVHLAARGLADGVPPARIVPGLKIWGFGPEKDQKVAAVMTTARAIGPARAAELFAAAIATDQANKSGLGEPVRNLERLTMRFAALAGSGPRSRG